MSNIPSLHLVKKSNKLVNSRQKFTAMQQRIILLGLANITDTTQGLDFVIPISAILGVKKGVKISGIRYKEVRKSAEDLTESSVKTEEINEDGKSKWRSRTFIIDASGEEGTDYISLSFHPGLKEFLMGLKKNFTTYLLEHVDQFKKAYSIRIYEFCKQYYPRISERKFTIAEFKLLLGLEDKYAKVSAFERSVIIPSLKEINSNSDILLEYKLLPEDKRSKKEIVFQIKKNPKADAWWKEKERAKREIKEIIEIVHQEVPADPKPTEKNKLPTFLDESFYQKLCSKHDSFKLDYYIQKVEALSNVSNKRGFLINALKEEYYQEELQSQEKKKERLSKQKQLKQQQKQKEELEKKAIQEYDQFRKTLFADFLQKASKEDLGEFLFEIEDSKNSQERKYYAEFEADLPSSLANNFYAQWLIRHFGTSRDIDNLDYKKWAKKNYNKELI